MDDAQPPAAAPDPSVGGRLTRDAALALLQRGDDLLASGDFAEAGQHFSRVVGFDDPAITAAALLGLGEAHYRLNNEAAAVQTGRRSFELPETPVDLHGLAQRRGRARPRRRPDRRHRRLPRGRQARARGGQGRDRQPARLAHQGDRQHAGVAALLRQGPRRRAARHGHAGDHRGHDHRVADRDASRTDGQAIYDLLQLDKLAVAAGEYWRLWTVTLLHGDLLHLIFNMYALWLVGLDRRALVWLDPFPGRSTWPARRPARPPASCSAAMCRRSARRARSSGCSASCWRPAGSTTRSTARAAGSSASSWCWWSSTSCSGSRPAARSTTRRTSAGWRPGCGSVRSCRRPVCRRCHRCGSDPVETSDQCRAGDGAGVRHGPGSGRRRHRRRGGIAVGTNDRLGSLADPAPTARVERVYNSPKTT